ncbi:hypothetical protein [Deinococcus sp. YIM 77859]|uniref:hypothetical protein n=1 Tax=Deinococcus sp. YIM 77859 TaxID=1540221 RepID=UPI0012E0AE4E|nr:hypothetical protein [Deinococcus sp. YIM 77859]
MKGTTWAAQQHYERAVAHHEQLLREAQVARLLASGKEASGLRWPAALQRRWTGLLVRLHLRPAL